MMMMKMMIMVVVVEEEGKKQHRTEGAKLSGRTEESGREREEEPPQLHILSPHRRALQTRDQFLSTKSNMTEPKA